MPLHPFLVHFTLSLALLFGIWAIFPKLGERIPAKGRRLAENSALLFLILAGLSGGVSLENLEARHLPIPPLAALHRLLALSGASLFLLLWVAARSRFPLPMPVRRVIAFVGLLLVLSAAGVGGHLVYEDRLGTDFTTASPPPESPGP